VVRSSSQEECSAYGSGDNSDFFEVVVSDSPWSALTGDGRTRGERAADKAPLAYHVLLDRLNASTSWGDHVERVAQGEDPFEVARIYGNGVKRRRVIVEMLVRATAGHGEAIAYTVPDDSPGGAGSSRYSAPFWLHTIRGAECVARLGDKRCLECATLLDVTLWQGGGPSAKSSRVLYCTSCAPAADEHADRDAMHDVFSRAAAALAHR
ncbi:MAG TPA: hypothetical protein VNA28_01255, partial [Solirubrobacteraceae bacterium]|nr:hypothetical protein [Solirubrobacteraceae bacterium]